MSASSSDMTTILANLLGQGAVTGASILGNNSTTGAQVTGYNNAINTLGNTQAMNTNLLGTQEQTGNSAMTSLQSYLGLNGQPADFSQFYNTPGYQFAVNQGTNAIKSAAAANGSAYTPNTLASIGNYVQGAASTNYNNYIQQLLSTSQLGSTANATNVGSNLSTGTSIAQAQAQSGQASAAGAANQSGIIGNALSGLGGAGGISALISNLLGGGTGSPGGANASGAGSTLGGLGSVLGGLFNGGNNGLVGGVNGLNSTINTGSNNLDSLLANTGSTFSTGNLMAPTDTGLQNIDTTDPLSGLGDTPDLDLNFSGAGGQAANSLTADQLQSFMTAFSPSSTVNPAELSVASAAGNPLPSGSVNLGQVAGAGFAGFNLANAVGSGNAIGAASSAASLANDLGVPSSITSPVSTGAAIANTGLDIASGNYIGAAGGLIGLGGSAGIPSYVTQPLALALSALTGNPFGIAVNAFKVGGGLLNVAEGRNYNGSWTPDQSQIDATNATSEDQIAAGASSAIANDATTIDNALNPVEDVTASLAQVPNLVPTSPQTQTTPTFTAAQLADIGQQQAANFADYASGALNAGQYAGQPLDMMNQGEAETPVAPITPGAALQYAESNPQYQAYLQSQSAGTIDDVLRAVG